MMSSKCQVKEIQTKNNKHFYLYFILTFGIFWEYNILVYIHIYI